MLQVVAFIYFKDERNESSYFAVFILGTLKYKIVLFIYLRYRWLHMCNSVSVFITDN